MEFKQSTIGDILDSEREMVLRGAERFGEYYVNAAEFSTLLQQFLKSVDPDRFIFAMFLSQIRKHHTLALFSAVRLHHVQAMMDLRQVLEAGSCAAYAIVHTNPQDFADEDENGILDASQKLTNMRYAWLQDNFVKGSEAIKNMKGIINSATAHSNIVYAHLNFNFAEDSNRFNTPFFDVEDEYHVKSDLWMIANIAMGLMDLFYGINKGQGVIKFADDFVSRLKALEAENIRLKEEMTTHEKYRAAQERAEDSGH